MVLFKKAHYHSFIKLPPKKIVVQSNIKQIGHKNLLKVPGQGSGLRRCKHNM